MQFVPLIQAHRIGDCNTRIFQTSIQHQRILRLQLSYNHVDNSPTSTISSMQVDPVDYRYLMSSGSDRKLSIYDTWHASGKQNVTIPRVAVATGQQKHQHKKTINCVQWYPHDTGMFVTSSFDGTVKIWDTNRMKPVETMNIRHPVCTHHLSSISTNHSLIAAAASVQVRLADMRTGSTAHILRGHRGDVLSLRWSPREEHLLASGGEDNRVILWDVRHAKALLRNLGDDGETKRARTGTAHSGNINGLIFNEDGRFLLSFGTDERLKLWDACTGQNALVNYGRVDNPSLHRPLQMAMHAGGHASSVAFVPAGRHILVFDLFTGSLLRRLSEHFSNVRCCEYNPHNQELYTSAQSHNILLWSPGRGIDPSQQGGGNNGLPSNDANIAALRQDSWSDSD